MGEEMKNKGIRFAAALLMLTVAQISYAEPLSIKPGDTLQKQIEAQKGKKITIRLQSGEELTGTVRATTNELIHLGELSGKEFFDALIDVNKVTALIVRTK
jgi:F0F1-type ATP synthase delta subunit